MLMRTLKKGLRDAFTPELCDAWIDASRLLASAMKEAAHGSTRAAIKGAA